MDRKCIFSSLCGIRHERNYPFRYRPENAMGSDLIERKKLVRTWGMSMGTGSSAELKGF